jgi:hypothetical protein
MIKQNAVKVLHVLMLLAVLVALSSVGIAAYITRDAQLIQRIQTDPSGGASLFADPSNTPGVKIGSPQMMMVSDPKAFLPQTGSSGERLVDDGYLQKNKIYPLQVKTVVFFRNTIAGIALIVLLLLGITRWWLMRSIKLV